MDSDGFRTLAVLVIFIVPKGVYGYLGLFRLIGVRNSKTIDGGGIFFQRIYGDGVCDLFTSSEHIQIGEGIHPTHFCGDALGADHLAIGQ